jgi:hypothetical protein
MSVTIPFRSRSAASVLLMVAAAACGGSADTGAAPMSAGVATTLGALDSLASPAGPGSAEPNIAVAPDGGVYLSWIEPTGEGSHALRFASLADSGWSAPGTIVERGDLFVNWADFPSLLPLGGGRLAAHWLERGTARGAYDIRLVQSRDGGASWSEPVTPHRDGTPTEHGFVSLWPAGDSVAAVWLDGRQYAPGSGGEHELRNEMTLVTAAIAADGSVGVGAEQTLDRRTCDCCQTDVAMTARGPLVVYRDRSAEEVRDIAAVRLVNGAWTEPAPVSNDGWTIAACPVNGPAVAARGDTAVVVWFTGARDTARVQLVRSTDGGATWGTPTRLDGGSPVGRVDVTLLADGSAVASWLERSGGEEAALQLRRVSAGGVADAPRAVARSGAARSSGFPRMAADANWLYIAWTEPGSPSRVALARVALGGGQ